MNQTSIQPRLRRVAVLGLLFFSFARGSASEFPAVSIARSDPGLEFSWPATRTNANGAIERPYFEVQQSSDLQRWQPTGQRLRAPVPNPSATLNMSRVPAGLNEFYRVLSIPEPAAAKLGSVGAEVYGFAEAFAYELR